MIATSSVVHPVARPQRLAVRSIQLAQSSNPTPPDGQHVPIHLTLPHCSEIEANSITVHCAVHQLPAAPQKQIRALSNHIVSHSHHSIWHRSHIHVYCCRRAVRLHATSVTVLVLSECGGWRNQWRIQGRAIVRPPPLWSDREFWITFALFL